MEKNPFHSIWCPSTTFPQAQTLLTDECSGLTKDQRLGKVEAGKILMPLPQISHLALLRKTGQEDRSFGPSLLSFGYKAVWSLVFGETVGHGLETQHVPLRFASACTCSGPWIQSRTPDMGTVWPRGTQECSWAQQLLGDKFACRRVLIPVFLGIRKLDPLRSQEGRAPLPEAQVPTTPLFYLACSCTPGFLRATARGTQIW